MKFIGGLFRVLDADPGIVVVSCSQGFNSTDQNSGEARIDSLGETFAKEHRSVCLQLQSIIWMQKAM